MWERMGSGGLRRLQISRSGACSVRGGFDSHAFPPSSGAVVVPRAWPAVAAWAVLLALAAPGIPAASAATGSKSPTAPPAVAAAADSLHRAAADTTVRRTPALHDTLIIHETTVPAERMPVTADTTSDANAQPKRLPPEGLTGFDQPKWVMARSLAFPGWGQLHNGSWKKALLIGGVEVGFIAKLFDDKHTLNQELADISAAQAAGDAVREAALESDYNKRSDQFIGHQWFLGAVLAYSMLDAYIDAHFRNFHVGPNDDPALPPGERRSTGLRLSWQERF